MSNRYILVTYKGLTIPDMYTLRPLHVTATPSKAIKFTESENRQVNNMSTIQVNEIVHICMLQITYMLFATFSHALFLLSSQFTLIWDQSYDTAAYYHF